MKNGDKSKSNGQPTLFERLGKTEGIAAIVDDAIETHMNNPVIQKRFLLLKEQPEHWALIRQHTIEFFSAGSGGQATYSGKEMPAAHKGMNIRPEEFMEVVDDILIVLDKHQIDEGSKKDVLAILWSLKGMIVAQ